MKANTIGERHHDRGEIDEGDESGPALNEEIAHQERQASKIEVTSSDTSIERKEATIKYLL